MPQQLQPSQWSKKGDFKFSAGPWNLHAGADPFGPVVRPEREFAAKLKLYKDMAEGQVNRLIDRAAGIIKRSGVTAALEKFAAALPENLHRPVFANACNQILADGVVEDEEKEFINNLRKALNLPGDDAQMIAKVMVWKNQG